MPGSDKDDKGGKSTSKSDGPITTTQGVAVMGKETATDGDVDGDRTEGRFAGAIDLSDDGSSPGSPLPAIAVVAVVVALGAWRMIVLARRRRAEAAAGS